nr:hypothetical protein [Tanacetum cinerariifolium]GEX93976.1 hypothetical protein [Tanacetum cinerariifolium]
MRITNLVVHNVAEMATCIGIQVNTYDVNNKIVSSDPVTSIVDMGVTFGNKTTAIKVYRVGYEEVVVGEGVVVTSSSLEMLTNSCLGGIMVCLIFLEWLEEEALVEFMVEVFEEDKDGKKNEKDGLFNLKSRDQSRKA